MACSKYISWFTFAIALMAAGCELESTSMVRDLQAPIGGGPLTASPATMMFYVLDPTPGTGSYVDGGVVPFLVGSAVAVSQEHALTAAHWANVFGDLEDAELYLADKPDVGTAEIDGLEYMLIKNHSASRRVKYWLSFAKSFESATIENMSRTFGVGDDLMALVLGEEQQRFEPDQVATLRRPQDGNLAPSADRIECGYVGTGFGWPTYEKRQYSACFASFPEEQTSFGLSEDAPLVMLYPNSRFFASAPPYSPSGVACESDAGGPLFDGVGRVVGIYIASRSEECSFPSDPNHVAFVTNTTTKSNWSFVDRVRRLCTPNLQQSDCEALIEAPTCGNFGSQAGFEQTDLVCLPSGSTNPNPDDWEQIAGTECPVCLGMRWR